VIRQGTFPSEEVISGHTKLKNTDTGKQLRYKENIESVVLLTSRIPFFSDDAGLLGVLLVEGPGPYGNGV